MRCASCGARVPRGALICARCEAPLSLTNEPDKAPYDVPPSDPEQQAAARCRHRRVALIAALSAMVLALGGWSWWHFTRPAPVDVSTQALTAWSTHPKVAWSLSVKDVAAGPCDPCAVWEAGQIPGYALVTVATAPDKQHPVAGRDAKFRIAAVDPVSGRMLARSPWQTARSLYRCAGSATFVLCSGIDTSKMKSLDDPSGSSEAVAFEFALPGLRPLAVPTHAVREPIVQVDQAGAVGTDLLVAGWDDVGTSQAYVVTRYTADGKVRWTRSLDDLQQQFFGPPNRGLDIHDGKLWLRLVDIDNRGVAVDVATGKPTTLPSAVLTRAGRATVTTAGLEHHTLINGRDVGPWAPLPLTSQLTTGPAPALLFGGTGNGPGPGFGDAQVGVDVRDDSSGDRLWTRPGVDAPALCGDRLVLGDRAALNQDHKSQPQQLTVVDSWSGRPVSQFTTGGSALFTMFCAPGKRLVVLEPTRVRTIDLSTGKDLADVGTGGAFADPMGDGLLVSDLTSQTLRLIR